MVLTGMGAGKDRVFVGQAEMDIRPLDTGGVGGGLGQPLLEGKPRRFVPPGGKPAAFRGGLGAEEILNAHGNDILSLCF